MNLKVSPRGATSYGYTNKTQYETRTVQSMQCRPTIENSDCWFDCCYLTDAPCCFVKLLPADKWQADDTRPQAPWDIASPTSNGGTAVQLKLHLTHQQYTAISVLQ